MGRCRSIIPLAYRFGEKAFIMDTKSLDKQDKAHLQIYQNFMFAAKISVIAIIATLVIMAATLI
jgi:hypothetical protein